jgi:hypothetical protein
VNLPAEWVDVREYSKDGAVDVPMVESAIFEQLMRR